MIKIGILSISDSRRKVHEALAPYILECQNKVKEMLESDAGITAICGKEIITDPRQANEQAEWLGSQGIDGVVLNIAIFSFPNLSLLPANALKKPTFAVTLENAKLPGLVGLLANTGLLKQNGIKCSRIWGSENDPQVKERLLIFARAAYAATRIKGQILGVIGGRSIGMGTGAVNPNQVMKVFGVDIEHVDQSEILRLARTVDDDKVEKTLQWLSGSVREIRYDNDKLTEGSLREQIRYYYAIKDIASYCGMDFLGVKCHIEMSAHSGPPCLACAMMNDPYDNEGAKEPLVCACEADCDGALSMQLLKLVSGRPSFLMDVRYCDRERGLFTFCNCGSVPTWYAGKSDDPADDLEKVRLIPIIPKYSGKGCHVQFVSKSGEMTFCRLTHTESSYEMLVFKGKSIDMPEEKLQETTPEWPHMFVEVGGSADRILECMQSNHIHGTTGDHTAELKELCDILGIACRLVE